jgi:phage tail-like protein
MSITAVASLVQSAMPSGPGTRPVAPAYGLAFRFRVKVDAAELADLGSWQACSGLRVEFNHVKHSIGGQYTAPIWLAGEASWSKVTLRRAASSDSSDAVQRWLQGQAYGWLRGGRAQPATAEITLLDSEGKPVLTWVLKNVRPASWSCGDLDASSSKVAIETLELVHEGFTVKAGTGPAVTDQEPRVAPVTLDGPGGQVAFAYPPQAIQLLKTQRQGSFATPSTEANVDGQPVQDQGATISVQLNRPNITTYKLNGLVLEAGDVQSDVGRLDTWATSPPGKTSGQDTLPVLDFKWGTGFGAKVRIASLTAGYTRFTSQGVPVRAKIDLTLEEADLVTRPRSSSGPPPPVASGAAGAGAAPPAPRPRSASAPAAAPSAAGTGGGSAARVPRAGARNPSSGGIPGRSAHLLLQSESLAGLAQRAYADASCWRAIATANDLDDPLRVAPGTVLLLPAPSEVVA